MSTPSSCTACRIGSIHASSVPHEQPVWYEPSEQGDYLIYHCDICQRTWDTQDDYARRPLSLEWTWRDWGLDRYHIHVGYSEYQKRRVQSYTRLGPLTIIQGVRKPI